MLDYDKNWLPITWQISLILQRIWTLTSFPTCHFRHYVFIFSNNFKKKKKNQCPLERFDVWDILLWFWFMINRYFVFSLVVHLDQTCYNIFCMNQQTCMTNSINNMLEVCCNMFKSCYNFCSFNVSLGFVFMGLQHTHCNW
jgi:hypothetical protein